jgi:hypothetical protein
MRSSESATSPFTSALAPFLHALPPAFREQFLLPADASWRVLLEGRMERVWHRPRWVRPVLRLLARWAVLYPETGENVPTRMLIAPGRDGHGRPSHVWRRTFAFPDERRIDAEIVYEPKLNQVVEWMGPRKSFEMAWRPFFLPPRSIVVRAELRAIRLARLRVPLPRALRVTACAIDTAGPGDDELRCDLVVSHPLLGPVFGYVGDFRVARVEASRER